MPSYRNHAFIEIASGTIPHFFFIRWGCWGWLYMSKPYNWNNIIFTYFIKKPSLSYYKHSSINTNDYAIENKFVSLNLTYCYVKLIFLPQIISQCKICHVQQKYPPKSIHIWLVKCNIQPQVYLIHQKTPRIRLNKVTQNFRNEQYLNIVIEHCSSPMLK